MFDTEDPQNIWVSPDSTESTGTYEAPYCSLTAALKAVSPGDTIILKRGIYSEDQTFEISGTVKQPIQICAETEGEVFIEGSCWFFYDTSDLVVSGFIFKNAPHGSISVMGNCRRNRFHSMKFIDCGSTGKTSCTFFFGGSGGRFNLVETCSFIQTNEPNKEKVTAENALIGLMISQGDTEGGSPLKNHIFRRNIFRNYDYGILVGSNDLMDFESGHVVEYNKIEQCAADGIVIKCGDTQIRGNLISKCRRKSIVMSNGSASVVEDNRIIDSTSGISVNGSGHTVYNNCIVRCTEAAVTACSSGEIREAASNLFIQENTFIHCGSKDQSGASTIIAEQGSSVIIERNLFHGTSSSCMASVHNLSDEENCPAAQFVIHDNLISGSGGMDLSGATLLDVIFQDEQKGDFRNESGYGAQGWMLTPEGFDPHVDELPEGEEDYVEASVLEDEDGELVIPEDMDGVNAFGSFYPDALDPEKLFSSSDESWE